MLNHVFHLFVFIPVNDEIYGTTLPDVMSYSANHILVHNVCFVPRRHGRFHILRFHVWFLSPFVRDLVLTMFGSNVQLEFYAADGDSARSTILVYGYGGSSHFQGVVRCGRLLLKFSVRTSCQGVGG